MLDQVVLHRGLILEVDLGLATRHFVQGRLRDIEVAVLDQLRHLTVEEREQQRTDVRAVNVRIGHDDNLVVAQFIDVEFIAANPGAERHNKVTDFLTAQHPVKPGAFDVQDLTFQGQDRLCLAVTARLRRATGGVTLHQKDFGFGRVFFRAILELARKEVHIHRGLAAGQVAGLARCFAGVGGFDDLADDDLGNLRVFFKPFGQLFVHQAFDGGAHFRADKLVLGLRAELGVGHLDRQHAGQALAGVIPGEGYFFLLRDT